MGYLGNQITTVFPTSISVDTATISGNASVGGTLGVTGVSTLSDNIVFGASAKGVHLGVTSATASNLLDDYEEGTWTAELRGASARATTPVTQSAASYVKIGTTVYVQAYFANVDTSGASGTAQITGLPFTSINQLFPMNIMTFGQDYDDSTAVMAIHAYVENGTSANLIATKDNANWQVQSITAGSGKYVAFHGTYLTS